MLTDFLKRTEGSSVIEFAMLAPVALFILLGLLAWGLYFGAALSVQQLASEAARASVAGINDIERAKIAKNIVEKSASGYPFLSPKKMAVTAQPMAGDPTLFKVVVSFDSGDMPIWMMGKLLPLPDKTISRSATIKRGGL